MLTYPTPRSRVLPGAALLCLLSLLLFTSLRTCSLSRQYCGNRAQTTQLPTVTSVPVPQPPPGNVDPSIPVLALAQSPPHVQRVVRHLRRVRHWRPLPGFQGGRTFRNLEGLLPGGRVYREYDVRPFVSGVPRTAERVVVDATRRNFYYTTDHYETYTQILLP